MVTREVTHEVAPGLWRCHFTALGGPCELHLGCDDRRLAQQAAAAVEAETLRIEAKYSRYQPDSVLSQLNARAGLPCPIDAETHQLLNFAWLCFQQSDGLFDISSGVLRQAWDFRQPRLPEPQTLQPLLRRIGLERMQLQPDQVQIPADMELDLGGLGKEYAVDRAAAVCQQLGIRSGLIDFGGDIQVLGPKTDGSPWHVAVRNPAQPDTPLAGLPVYQGGVASSGNYERGFDLEGRRYCHILNPRTGYPVDYWASVTVVSGSALLAGCLSTIAMLKQATALEWLQQQQQAFLAVTTDGRQHRWPDQPSVE